MSPASMGDIWHLGNYSPKLMDSGLINEAGHWTLIQLDGLVLAMLGYLRFALSSDM